MRLSQYATTNTNTNTNANEDTPIGHHQPPNYHHHHRQRQRHCQHAHTRTPPTRVPTLTPLCPSSPPCAPVIPCQILFMVGRGHEAPSIVDALLDIAAHPTKPQYEMASDLPLVLFDCGYKQIEWIYSEPPPPRFPRIESSTEVFKPG